MQHLFLFLRIMVVSTPLSVALADMSLQAGLVLVGSCTIGTWHWGALDVPA